MSDGGRIDLVRGFNRFYTAAIGVLEDRLLDSPYSLAEARVLYEIAQSDLTTATQIAADLRLDAGYLSRVLRGLTQRGLVERRRSPSDARRGLLSLTDAGREAFAAIDRRSAEAIGAMLARLGESRQRQLCAAMTEIRELLAPERGAPTVVLRAQRPGDVGWVIHRHAVLYAKEYGWSIEFEALVAEIGARFIRAYDPTGERCWLAEKDGETVGSVFVVRQSKTVAKLRLMYVEPTARGLGIGRRMVDECLRFAQEAGYRKMVLWTNSVLVSARRIYEAAGFRLVASEPHHSFGHDLVGEIWERRIAPESSPRRSRQRVPPVPTQTVQAR
jgi:DNA-binding MarR family transcriptional regulator/GNAT superfamily N-acetyltransferase